MTSNDGVNTTGISRNTFNRKTTKPAVASSSIISSTPSTPAAVGQKPIISTQPTGSMRNAETKETKKASQLLMDEKQIEVLDSNITVLQDFIDHRYLQSLGKCDVKNNDKDSSVSSLITMYQLNKLILNENEDTYEKLVTLYTALYNLKATTTIILQSSGEKVNLYLCTKCNDDGTSGRLLASSIEGHFPGSEISQLHQNDVADFMGKLQAIPQKNPSGMRNSKYIRTVSVIPSRRSEERENRELRLSAQGLEKFIDGMKGQKYTVMLLATPVHTEIIDGSVQGLEKLYTMLSPFSRETVSYGENESDTTNYSLSVSISDSISESISSSYGTAHSTGTSKGKGGNRGSSSGFGGFGFNSGSCWNSGSSTSDTENRGSTKGSATQHGTGTGEVSGDSSTTGRSRTINLTRDVKSVQNCMKRLETEIDRINANRGFGMWDCCCYVITEKLDVAAVAAGSLQSLFCGDAEYGGSSYTSLWGCISDETKARRILKSVANMDHPLMTLLPNEGSSMAPQVISPSIMVSGRDLPTLLNLPRRSVPGIQVMSMAEFGRNIAPYKAGTRVIDFGKIVYMGNEENNPMRFDLDRFASHCFICGAAGSGKSNTTYNLLETFHQKGVPFMVIEPAKGEYKMEFAGMPGIQIFTCKPDSFRMLSINPFEFHKDVHIKEHLDHLNSVISTCWPLYGPMPAMLKKAFELAYINCGWDLELSERVFPIGNPFPTFADVLPAIEQIINDSSYSSESKGDYKGALCMRVEMLTNGFEGIIFGSPMGISDLDLFGKNTIIDLSNIGNPETRALIMGILIIKLREYRFATQKKTNNDLCHVTVLEEAHNILKRCSKEQTQDSGNVQGAAVGALVECIAEMRSSGEGFLIIDQSPGSVDEAALKNTAIKIVMRLPERSDCEAIASTMGLTEEQMRELAHLDRGVAAVYHEGWVEPVLGKMGEIWALTPQAKKYRVMPGPVNRIDLLRTKGALCQWLCSLFQEDELDSLRDMVALKTFISSFRSAGYAPSLNDNIWADLSHQFLLLINEIKSSFGENLLNLNDYQRNKMELMIGRFIRQLLQIDGIFRSRPLSLSDYSVAKNITNPSAKQSSEIDNWWKEIRDVFRYYIVAPVRYGVKPLQWSSEPLQAEYMKFALQMVFYSFGKEYTKSNNGLSIYECAYFVLRQTYLKC